MPGRRTRRFVTAMAAGAAAVALLVAPAAHGQPSAAPQADGPPASRLASSAAAAPAVGSVARYQASELTTSQREMPRT
ncbi:MAG: hypothetical protein ACKONH_04090, partial [Planctomycetia bacterium]